MCTKKDYQFFLKKDLKNYSGKWIAILDNKIISSGISGKKVYKEAVSKSHDRTPLMVKVPSNHQTLIL